MSLFDWFGGRRQRGHDPAHSRMLETPSEFGASRMPSSGSSRPPLDVRKDLLRLVLRDTLNRNGVPTQWVVAEGLVATARNRQPGLHVRFVVRHWDPRLMVHAVALQENFETRLQSMDPLADEWLRGFSWSFSLPSGTQQQPLPHPGVWTALRHDERPPVRPDPVTRQAAFDVSQKFDRTEPAVLRTEPAPLSSEPAMLAAEPAAL